MTLSILLQFFLSHTCSISRFFAFSNKAQHQELFVLYLVQFLFVFVRYASNPRLRDMCTTRYNLSDLRSREGRIGLTSSPSV